MGLEDKREVPAKHKEYTVNLFETKHQEKMNFYHTIQMTHFSRKRTKRCLHTTLINRFGAELESLYNFL